MIEVTVPARATRIVAAIVFLAMGAGALWESARLQGLPGSDGVGSGAFPGLAAVALTIAALGLLSGWGDRSEPLVIEAPLRVFAALLALIAFVVAMGQVPILAAIAVFVAVFQFVLGERRLFVLAGGTVAITVAVWVMFGLLLNVPL